MNGFKRFFVLAPTLAVSACSTGWEWEPRSLWPFGEDEEIIIDDGSTPDLVLRQDGMIVAVSQNGEIERRGPVCTSGFKLRDDRLIVEGGLPASFTLDITNAPGRTVAEVAVAGGTVTRLSPQASRVTTVRGGQTVEIARMPLTGIDSAIETLRFNVVPITGTSSGGTRTISVQARVLSDDGSALSLGSITAGGEERLCGPAD